MSCKYIYNNKDYTKEELVDFLVYNGKNINSLSEYNFFGDWQNDPQNASKVVDENGEPMVVQEVFINSKYKITKEC